MIYPIPNNALDDRLAYVGIAGSGKTYGAGIGVERLMASGARVVIPDPLGVWWGLAVDVSGKSSSEFRKKERLIVFGGPRGDLALTEYSGALIGETVAGMAESCILDLSELGTKASERRFMLAFLIALYRHKTKVPLHIIFDEADMWAPQKLLEKEGDSAKLLGMMETVVRRGRTRGFIPWLITQRPAVLSKDVLSQIDGLVAFKLTSSQDRNAIGDWVHGQADKEQWENIWAELPTMERGRGVVWLPARSILKISTFPAKTTFDSSRAPRRGEHIKSATPLKPVNLDRLKARLVVVETEAKANDPIKLKERLAELSKEIATLKALKATPDRDAVREAEKKGFEQARKKLTKAAEKMAREMLMKCFAGLREKLKPVDKFLAAQESEARKVTLPASNVTLEQGAPVVMPKPKTVTALKTNGAFNGTQTRILRSLATWRALGQESPTKEMVAAVAGYKVSGHFNNVLGGLKSTGAIDYPVANCITLCIDEAPMSPREAAQTIISTLDGTQTKIVRPLVTTSSLSREELAAASGYEISGHFNNVLGALRTRGVIVYPTKNFVALSDWAKGLLAD